jgi:AraC family transcriptional regulator, arabinose operon regulatory protein
MSSCSSGSPNLEFVHCRLINHVTGNWSWFSRRRQHYNFWMALSGSGKLIINDEVFQVSPGMAILIHPDDAVQGFKSEDEELSNIGMHFLLSTDSAFTKEIEVFCSHPFQISHVALIHELARYMCQLMEFSNDSNPSDLNDLCRQILRIMIYDKKSYSKNPVDRVILDIGFQMRYHPERHISIPELSQQTGLSHSQFSRRFREIFGNSPMQFLISQKLTRAAEMLVESRLRVNEISDKLGYQDVAFFSRQFKKRFGKAPLLFRKQSSFR